MIQDGTMWIASCGPVFNEYSHDGAMVDPKEGVLGLPPPPLCYKILLKKVKMTHLGDGPKLMAEPSFLTSWTRFCGIDSIS